MNKHLQAFIEAKETTLADLENAIPFLQTEIENRKEAELEGAYNQILSIAENVGLSVESLLELGSQKNKKATRKPVEPRYRNKNNSEETWTGRGKQPRWLTTELEKGAKLEDFLI